MIEESIQGSASDVPDRNTGLMQPDEDMPAGAPVGVQPDDEEAHAIERELKRIKGYLWNGNHREALACIDGLANDLDDLEDVPTTYPGIKAFRKGVDEFHTYVRRNAHTIPNYAERHRYGERVSTAFAESTVNAVVGKRFAKR